MIFSLPKKPGTQFDAGMTFDCTSEALRSDFHDDPEMTPLVEGFVVRLPKRLSALEGAIREADWKRVALLSHQLKGAAGGYGFPSLTKLAEEIEAAAILSVSSVSFAKYILELGSLCQRALNGISRP